MYILAPKAHAGVRSKPPCGARRSTTRAIKSCKLQRDSTRVAASPGESHSHRGDRLVADGDRIVFLDPTTQRMATIYTVELPSSDSVRGMGIVFRDAGMAQPIVDSVVPNSEADRQGVTAGDVMLRCTAVEIPPKPYAEKPRQIVYDASLPTPNGTPATFDTSMAALRSSGIVSTGYRHQTVILEMKRDAVDAEEHDEYARLMKGMAEHGRLEIDREIHESVHGEDSPAIRAPGERPDGSDRETLFQQDDYPWDD